MIDEPIVSGKRVCKLMLVEVNSDADVVKGKAKQSNKFYNMYEQEDGTFIALYGRVDSSCQRKVYPISKWDSTIRSKTNPKKGYKDVTHLFHEEEKAEGETKAVDIQDRVIKRVMDELQAFASNSVKQNYNVSSRAVTQAMVDEAQASVDKLADMVQQNADVEDINKELLHLYHIIPRKMTNVNDHLIQRKTLTTTKDIEDVKKLIENEQDTLDVMAGQVLINTKEDEDAETKTEHQDILGMLGLEMREATSDEVETVKRLMGPNVRQFKAAYKVVNKATQSKYDKQVAAADNKKEELFWHGSRNQNWLNIISTGLLIRPSGAIHTGSMFGDGIYFADKAQKSIGYTSLRGSYWASGSDNKAYLALFSVHVGEQKHIHRHDYSCYSLCEDKLKREGKDSVFAHGGADLRNNEYIVYNSAQCTISYLVEISN